MKRELLEIRNGFMKKGREYILRDINFYIYTGETVSICGFHGVGKSTLARVMSGKLILTEGDVYWDEKHLKTSDVSVYQNFLKDKVCHIYELTASIYNFAVYDYMFAMRPASWKKILYNKKSAILQMKNLLNDAEIDINPQVPMEDLSRWQKFMLQILKAAVYGAKIIILDEVAMEFGIEELWPFLERMKKRYGVSFIYISSVVDMAVECSDRAYIMRERSLVYMSHQGKEEHFTLEKALFQYGISNLYKLREYTDSPVILKTSILSPKGESIPFEIRQGEVAGVLDLDGKIRESIIDRLSGDALDDTYVKNEKVCSYRQLNEKGIYIIHEREQENGFFDDLSLKENILISGYKRFQSLGIVNQKLIDFLWNYRIHPLLNMEDELELTYLNKVKVILLKKLILNPQLLILDNFTLYLDPIEREEILKFIGELSEQGIGFLLISSSLPEAYSICDKILILQGQGKWRLFERETE
ncbi:Galactose/methyl galactoside import ATP-binding protein MglA [Blautia producta]|uniref:Galactose/methyl galactoside import ATP-binding protein MglA n=2 Tax=Blautia producta TaxID=33035 RepID=A0A4P6LXP9_9FIRM|nr:Galactose/methyl galactoside import ATP-binding protein MglA [Blautia producta]